MDDNFIYLGRSIPKESFRAFVYNKDSEKFLVNSYSEYTKAMDSGIWFDSIKKIPNSSKESRRKKS